MPMSSRSFLYNYNQFHLGFIKAPNSEICVPDSPLNSQKQINQICTQCSNNAQCIQNGNEWQCICVPGFYGNGFDCRPQQGPLPAVVERKNLLYRF